jgi:hypothetical protein
LQSLYRVRYRLIGERTAAVNEIRAFLLVRGIAAATGIQRLRKALPGILPTHTDVLSPRMTCAIIGLATETNVEHPINQTPRPHIDGVAICDSSLSICTRPHVRSYPRWLTGERSALRRQLGARTRLMRRSKGRRRAPVMRQPATPLWLRTRYFPPLLLPPYMRSI